MHDAHAATGDEEWVIWNGGHGLVTTAALGRVETDSHGRKAWLEEPFDMVGPFSLDELEAQGRIAFAACIVMSRRRWQEDQAALKRESATLRRAAQACACATGCNVHGHAHASAWGSRLPVADLKSFWGALGCACWAV